MKKSCIFLFFILLHFLHADDLDILLLHSYHEGFSWTGDINRSVQERIIENYPKTEFHVEFMDSKRFPPTEIFPKLRSFYEDKYKEQPLDLIILSDNNALEFIRENKKECFGDLPVFFCCINDF